MITLYFVNVTWKRNSTLGAKVEQQSRVLPDANLNKVVLDARCFHLAARSSSLAG
jgi:hypothetical protein